MQKWCPRPLQCGEGGEGVFAPGLPAAAGAELAPLAATPAAAAPQRFRKESGFADAKALMCHLTPDERALVFELVELDVAKEYARREEQIKAECAEQVAAARSEFAAWSQTYAQQAERELREIARAAVRLAARMAERIVRAQVAHDPQVLVRAIETVLLKVHGSRPLTATVNPQDAAWLGAQPELLQKLRIKELVPDRRVAAGGCRLEGQGQEWDATLGGQIEALAEALEESMAEPAVVPGEADGSGHGPALG